MSWSVWLSGGNDAVRAELEDVMDAAVAAIDRIDDFEDGQVTIQISGSRLRSGDGSTGGGYSVNASFAPSAPAPEQVQQAAENQPAAEVLNEASKTEDAPASS